MPDLTDLLARWHETAPDECYVEGEAFELLGFDGMTIHGVEYFMDVLDVTAVSGILGAVVYHAARRGYESFHNVKDYGEGQKQVVFLIQNPASLKKASVGTIAYPRHDGAAALRALATSALSAYLDAISHE